MKPIEEQIIKSLLELKESKELSYYEIEREINQLLKRLTQKESKELSYYEIEREINQLLKRLTQEESLGTSSEEFRNHPELSAFIAKTFSDTQNYFMLWLQIEDYLSSKSNISSAQKTLAQVEEALKKCLKNVTLEAKARGTAMLPREIANAQFMRNLYSLNEENLSTLFLKYLPAPRAKVFAGQAMPDIIAKREQASLKAIKDVLGRNENNLASVEKKLINVQRKFRAKRRKQENLKRLPYLYQDQWQGPDKPQGMTTEGAKQLLANANKPYQPQCEEKLANRIMEAAKKVELFSTVSHLTAASALEPIFNDGLFGRRSILQFYMPFRPASLWQSDIEDGDANVVCLGPNEIDPQARHGIELQFDAKKIAENNPCVFYKQRDLGYDLKKTRSIKIGNLDLHFSHTGTYRCQPPDVSSLVLFRPNGGQYAWSNVTKAILIADNLKEMHRILTLNFFRFVDGLMNSDFSEKTDEKNKIYSALGKLNDQELVKTLLQIGKNMTDSMEFNFYGAYKIDFSALLTIKNERPAYTLDLPSFVNALKAGNLEELNEARKKLPEIFNSYRFIDYLLSTTNNEKVIAELQNQRKKCTLPAWMEESKQDCPRTNQNNINDKIDLFSEAKKPENPTSIQQPQQSVNAIPDNKPEMQTPSEMNTSLNENNQKQNVPDDELKKDTTHTLFAHHNQPTDKRPLIWPLFPKDYQQLLKENSTLELLEKDNYNFIQNNIFEIIQRQIMRLEEKYPIKKNQLETISSELREILNKELDQANLDQAKQKSQKPFLDVCNRLHEKITSSSTQKIINSQNNMIGAFLKGLAGTLLAAMLAFIPLISSSFRGTFFKTTTAKDFGNMERAIKEKTMDKRASIHTDPTKKN